MKNFLHVGSGFKFKAQTTREFASENWKEIRLDIDPNALPDIHGLIVDMHTIESESFEAIFSSHNLEHVYFHKVSKAIKEFCGVLKNDGYVVITVPDLQSICELIAKDNLLEEIYEASTGPVAPVDVIYGYRPSRAQANYLMVHKCGFTQSTLIESFLTGGFKTVAAHRGKHPFARYMGCRIQRGSRKRGTNVCRT